MEFKNALGFVYFLQAKLQKYPILEIELQTTYLALFFVIWEVGEGKLKSGEKIY